MSSRITRFEIRNYQGDLVAIHVRRDHDDGHKDFWWERPDGSTGLNGFPIAQLPLYGSEAVAGWAADEPIIIVEGEKARGALTAAGFRALATVTGAASCPDLGPLLVLRGHHVILWPDNDDQGRAHMLKLAQRLGVIAASVRNFEWTGAPEHGDAFDYLADGPGAAERLRSELAQAPAAVVGAAPVPSPPSVAGLVAVAFENLSEEDTREEHIRALRRLAALARDLDELGQVALRHEAIDRLKSCGATPQEAKDLVRAGLPVNSEPPPTHSGQGSTLDLEDPSPWPESVDGPALADEMASQLRRYIVLPDESVWAVVLWLFFTYLLEVVPVAPRLLMTSPTKACGKTRLLSLLSAMARRALPGSSLTPAAVFRVIESHMPTLLVDELDNLGLKEKPDLLAVLNSGHTRGTASVLRTVGEEHEVHSFSTWCALAMAGIRADGLPDTISSRAIRVELVRKLKSDRVAPMRERRLHAELEPVRRQLVRWSADYAKDIEAADPDLPEVLDGRAADNWSVLISIADALGGEWPTRARQAATVIERAGTGSISAGEMLLADLHALFETRATDRLTSEQIVTALTNLEGRPWAEWGRQRKPLSKNQLARLLKDFGIEPRTIRPEDGVTAKGYVREGFEDAWARYLSPDPGSEPSHRHNAGMTRSDDGSATVTGELAVTDQNRGEAAPRAACDGVTVEKPSSAGSLALPPGPLRAFLDQQPHGLNQ